MAARSTLSARAPIAVPSSRSACPQPTRSRRTSQLETMSKSAVLVIDDELHIRQFLRAAFEFEGFNVREAANADEGIRSATLQPPDLVILDLGLPRSEEHTSELQSLRHLVSRL